MQIRVTQYLRPDGRQKVLRMEIPDSYQEQYDLIRSCGCELTCEQLRNGTAVHYISSIVEENDFAIEITPVGDTAAAEAKLLEMIATFDKERFECWREQLAIAE